MEKLPNSLVLSFWNNLSSEWKVALRTSFNLSGSLSISDIQEILHSTYIGINVTSNQDEEDYVDVKHIQPIKYFTELEKLTLQATTIGSLQPLSSLKKLKSLHISNCIFDTNSLIHLVQLEELSIWGCDIETTKYIKELKNLKKLDLINTRITDISNLLELKNLSELNCWGDYSYDKQLDIIKQKNPKCKINELKQSFELMDFLNNNPDADMSDFGYHSIDLTENNDKWTFESAPEEVILGSIKNAEKR